MRWVLAVLALAALCWAGLIFYLARSAVHEIQGYIALLIATLLVVGAAIVHQIHRSADAPVRGRILSSQPPQRARLNGHSQSACRGICVRAYAGTRCA